MRLPLPVRLLGAMRSITGGSVAQLDPADVPAARERSARVQSSPLGRAVLGRRPRDVMTEETGVDTGDVTLPVRVYRPPSALAVPPPLVMNFHGGGFVQGDLDQSDWFCGQVALRSGAVVVSVDYRLAPEHPFPTPARDCFGATAAIASAAAAWGVDGEHVVVMGDSAGGTLAAVSALMARDERRAGRPAPRIVGQCLVYPGSESVDVLPSEREVRRSPLLSGDDIRGYRRLHLMGADGTHPYASPLRADHTDLPPALIQTAEHDTLRDHGIRYAEALAAAGTTVRHTDYQGAPHGFVSLPRLVPAAAHQAAWEAARWVREVVSDRAPTVKV